MKVIKKIYPISDSKLLQKIFTEDSFFLDIETTGFQPNYQHCYLIGCMFNRKDYYELIQYFAENEAEEANILTAFLNDISTKKKIITFNGDMFDLPFLKKRFEKHSMQLHTELFHSIDIFKETKKCKNMLLLPNYKQKTIECFLQINREDTYSGGELISIYKDYEKSQDPEKEKLLLLHNAEDVRYMLPLLKILEYKQIRTATIDSLKLTSDQDAFEVYFEGTISLNIPIAISLSIGPLFCKLNKNHIIGVLRSREQTYKYFFSNYKDYDYIMNENIILPKLLSASIAKDQKRKAKKEECYAEKQGYFLPIINSKNESEIYENIRIFKHDYKSKDLYFLVESEVLNDTFLKKYIACILHSL